MTELSFRGKEPSLRKPNEGHKWILRSDGKYECESCGMTCSEQTFAAMNKIALAGTTKLPMCKSNKNLALDPQKPTILITEDIEKLFTNVKVVSLEQLQPLMKTDAEQFWTGIDTDLEGMLAFLDRMNFEIIPCYQKGETLQSEIYVNFEKFRTDYLTDQPDVTVSPEASRLCEIETLRKSALTLASEVSKKKVRITIFGYDGFRISFSERLGYSDFELRKMVLEKLAKEMDLKFPEQREVSLPA